MDGDHAGTRGKPRAETAGSPAMGRSHSNAGGSFVIRAILQNAHFSATTYNLLMPDSVALPRLLDRITIDAEICHGKPCIRHLRYPVEMLLDLLSSGMTSDQILADYPDIERDDILAALAFAARLSRVKSMDASIS
jgi:uncharacterized protein (DUF433 family)